MSIEVLTSARDPMLCPVYGFPMICPDSRLQGGAAIAKRTVDATQGNFGIEDQRLALAWVKDHISAFGGDGDDITIFGESAGGNSVFNHLVTKSSFGFYTKAVIESGLYNAGVFLTWA